MRLRQLPKRRRAGNSHLFPILRLRRQAGLPPFQGSPPATGLAAIVQPGHPARGLPMDTREDNSSVLSLDYVAKTSAQRYIPPPFKAFASSVDHIMSNELRPNFMMVDALFTVDALTVGGNWNSPGSPAPAPNSTPRLISAGSPATAAASAWSSAI